MRVNLLLLFFTFIYCCGASRFVIGNLEASHFAPRHKLHTPIAQQVLRSQNTENIYSTTGAIVSPLDFGADPHGKEDSTKAFLAAIKTITTQYGSNHTLAENIIDVGGAVLDLQGGDYLVSLPLSFPPLYGNFLIKQGTIRASSNFPSDRYLIEVGSNSVGDIGNENIGFENLMLDCQHYALGGLLLNKTMGINVGPRIFVLGFTQFGITVNGGHEVVIHEAWLGQYLFSDPRYHNKTYLNGTGIAINGNDHFITNTIVFSSLVGVSVSGEANLLTGVHTWNLMEGSGGTGILVSTPPGYTQNRIVSCYLDYNDIVVIDPEHLTIVDGFFLCGGNIIIRAETDGHIIEGLVISDNQFDGCDGGPSIVVDESIASFSGVYDTKIDGNMYNGYTIEGTRATLQVHNTSSIFVFNFTNVLLFSTIQNVQYSIQINEPSTFVQHASRPPNGLIVIVETSQSVDATITVTVDQSLPSQSL